MVNFTFKSLRDLDTKEGTVTLVDRTCIRDVDWLIFS
jgi:hypothetical protein